MLPRGVVFNGRIALDLPAGHLPPARPALCLASTIGFVVISSLRARIGAALAQLGVARFNFGAVRVHSGVVWFGFVCCSAAF